MKLMWDLVCYGTGEVCQGVLWYLVMVQGRYARVCYGTWYLVQVRYGRVCYGTWYLVQGRYGKVCQGVTSD